MAVIRHLILITALAVLPVTALAQTTVREQCARPRAELLGVQATYIGQNLRPFTAAYSGPMSFDATGDRQLSQSYGAYAGVCVRAGLAVYADAEMVRGAGISHASGVGAVTNGDVLRQGSFDLGDGPYFARVFARWSVPLDGRTRDTVERGMDALPGTLAGRRFEVTAGKFAAGDVFDVNRYANSTRSQFLNWVLISNGAWDYPADTRGYSNGVALAWIDEAWEVRAGSFQMPRFANGNVFDSDLANARGDVVEVTRNWTGGAIVRALAYANHARMGRYDAAISAGRAGGTAPNIVADDAPGRVKYGFALNGEFPIADKEATGVFGRAGWSDGKNESFAFTEVDTHFSVGMQVSGRRWGRGDDLLSVATALNGLSGSHRAYLAAGGTGFLLGDGALRYGAETLLEGYYKLQIGPWVAISPDVMLIVNPGYNRDRGPATVFSIRTQVHR